MGFGTYDNYGNMFARNDSTSVTRSNQPTSEKTFINSVNATNPIETTKQTQEPTLTDVQFLASLGLEGVNFGKLAKYLEQPTHLGSLSSLPLAQVPQEYSDMANLLPPEEAAATNFYTDLAYVSPAGKRTEVGGENIGDVGDALGEKGMEAFYHALYDLYAPSEQA